MYLCLSLLNRSTLLLPCPLNHHMQTERPRIEKEKSFPYNNKTYLIYVLSWLWKSVPRRVADNFTELLKKMECREILYRHWTDSCTAICSYDGWRSISKELAHSFTLDQNISQSSCNVPFWQTICMRFVNVFARCRNLNHTMFCTTFRTSHSVTEDQCKQILLYSDLWIEF